MKILVTLPEKFNKSNYTDFLNGIDALKSVGHNVEYTFNAKTDSSSTFTKTSKQIKDTDVLIADVSEMDAKQGYEIAKALSEKKFVIAVYKKEEPQLLKQLKEKNILSKSYDKKDLKKLMLDLANEAKSKLDTKFILIISPEIDRYLEWGSQLRRMHKAQIVRDALEAVMKKDKEYKDYLSK